MVGRGEERREGQWARVLVSAQQELTPHRPPPPAHSSSSSSAAESRPQPRSARVGDRAARAHACERSAGFVCEAGGRGGGDRVSVGCGGTWMSLARAGGVSAGMGGRSPAVATACRTSCPRTRTASASDRPVHVRPPPPPTHRRKLAHVRKRRRRVHTEENGARALGNSGVHCAEVCSRAGRGVCTEKQTRVCM